MVVKKSFGENIFDFCNILFLSILMVACFYPIWYVTVASLSDGNLLIRHSGLMLKPLGFSIDAYKKVFTNPMITGGYLNTIFVVVSGLAVNISLTSFAAYVLSRKGAYFVNIIMRIIIFTMFFSGGLIPLYLTVKNIGLLNNLWALILPNAIITYNMIIMRTNFAGIPDSIEESAKLDGANDFVILFRIVLPLSKAVLAVMVLYYGVHHWNAWFHAMIFLRDRSLYPLQLILREILIDNSMSDMMGGASMQDSQQIGDSIKYATVMVATLPILFVYPFIQKYFVKGVMVGALKG